MKKFERAQQRIIELKRKLVLDLDEKYNSILPVDAGEDFFSQTIDLKPRLVKR
jgi:hypothetical protein